MYYETIKVLDCTIRDGGLVNKHDFSLEFVRRLYMAVSSTSTIFLLNSCVDCTPFSQQPA